MKLYKDINGNIYTGDKVNIDDFELSENECNFYLGQKNKELNSNIIKSELNTLDQKTGTTRTTREYFISIGYAGYNDKIINAELEAEELRAKLIE